MLTALHVEGFESMVTRQRIELAPLTLLVGREGMGKEILAALLYLRQLLESGRADVRGHELERAIVLRADFTTPGRLDPLGRDAQGSAFPDLEDEIEAAWIELTVRMQSMPGFHGPLIERVAIGTAHGSEPLVWLQDDEPLRVHVDLRHPLLDQALGSMGEVWSSLALPGFDRGPRPAFGLSRARSGAWPSLREPLRVIPPTAGVGDGRAFRELCSFLEQIVVGIGSQLAHDLGSMLHLGSFRTLPPQGFLDEHEGRSASWAHGLAAWDHLLSDRSTLVERSNHWLARLGTGCSIGIQTLSDPTARSLVGSSVVLRRLRLHRSTGFPMLPSEAGAGLTQLLPVIVAALEAPPGLSLIEQPELHVHPTIQLGLGDLFIEAATHACGRRVLMVETHSEHLVLRVLRRIRESTRGERLADHPGFSRDALSLLHVTEGSDGVRIERIGVDPHGGFFERWPKGFFDERAAEAW